MGAGNAKERMMEYCIVARTLHRSRLQPWQVIWALALLLCGCSQQRVPAERTGLRLAQLPIAYSAITQLAVSQGYVAAAGVAPEIISVPAGPDVVTALRAQSDSAADAGTIAITPVVTMIGANDHPIIIATTMTSRYQ